MPRFDPFPALRYRSDLDLGAVSAPPYDVLSPADADRWRAAHPVNVVHVDLPDEADGPERYSIAADRLQRWVADGILVPDTEQAFTLYRMRFTDEAGRRRDIVGVVGALEVVDEGAGGVLPHERTTPKAKSDRLDLTRATSANLSPVWGLSLTAGLTDLLREPGEALGRFVDHDGVEHVVERVTDPARVAAIADAVGANPVLIADGHHRYAIARTFRDEQRTVAESHGTDAETTMTFVAELVEDQLSIDAIHRVYRGVDPQVLASHLAKRFAIEPAGEVSASFAAEVVDRGALCLIHPDGTGSWLTPRPECFGGVRALDGAYLEAALDGLAGVDVSYQHGVEQTVELVTSGDADAAVLIRPTSIAEIRRTADEGELMPPKSTFFTPKLRTGLVIRPLTRPATTRPATTRPATTGRVD